MSNFTLDHIDDFSKKELYNYLSGHQIPQYVKNAEEDTFETKEMLPKTAFASTGKSFPINTKARTYLSYVFLKNKEASIKETFKKQYFDDALKNVKQAADAFGIQKDLDKYDKEYLQKQAGETWAHTLSIPIGDDELELYSVKNASETHNASIDFVKNIRKYPFAWRRKIANHLYKAAEDFELEDLPDLVLKYAGFYIPDPTHIEDEIARRSGQIKDAAKKEQYQKLAEGAPTASYNDLLKIAGDLDMFEDQEGLYANSKVAAILGDVVDKVFTLSMEKVANIIDVVNCHDKTYHIRDLQKVGAHIYKEATGIDIDPSNKDELREVIPTIPRSDMALLEELSGLRSI